MVSQSTGTDNQLDTPYPPTPEDQPTPEEVALAEEEARVEEEARAANQSRTAESRAEDGSRIEDQSRIEDRPVAGQQEPVELSPVSTTAGDSPLFSDNDTENFQVEWRALQSEFVDDPREAVQRADELVAQVMQALADTFAEHKHALEEQWREGEQVQTEELRQALKRYRVFFDRLLSV